MRAGLAVIAVLALSVAPVAAQGKTKGSATPQSVQVLELCEKFATGDVLAVQDAMAKGWDAYEQDSESPYVQSFAGSKDLPGIGSANLFALIEDYPNETLGYCRVDVAEPTGDGNAAIQAIQNLDRYEGQSQLVSDGSFASLTGREDKNRLLLAHWSAESFVVQLSIITPKAETAD
jgi:hypothetical protein